ncbi:MAG: HlyD family efflux transporter periplasmic adaptor subunit [Planctomycetota bacterium]
MRSLQRRRFVLPPPAIALDEASQPLGRGVRAIEWRIWRARLRFAALFVLMPALLFLVCRWYLDLRVVADGLVANTSVVLRAPAPVRIAEVFCHDGESVHRGDALLRLEARAGFEERHVLECSIEARRLRVALFEQGGTLQDVDLGHRGDQLEQARDEQSRADGDYRVALAELERLRKQRDSQAIVLQQDAVRREGDLGVLTARVQAEAARFAGAQSGADLARDVMDRHARLGEDGDLSPLDLQSSAHGLVEAEQDSRAAASSVSALEKEVEKSERLDQLARQLQPLTLSELDARIEAQRERVKALQERRDLWSRIIARREQLSPEQNAGELRNLELELLRTDLHEAETQLRASDARLGNLVLHAEGDLIVDQLFVAAGHLVDQGQPLLSCLDPATQWAVAYLTADQAARVARGQRCRLVLGDLNLELDARVASISRTWVPCPALVPHADDYDLRLPVRIEPCDPRDRARLLPGARLRVLFATPRRPA